MSQQSWYEWLGIAPDLALADGEARFAAVNPHASFIVQAPAGSGKTALLTQRFLALLSQVDQPEKIVAMTFTKKAAAEMRERIIAALKKGLQPEPLADASLFERNSWLLAQKALQQNELLGWALLENPNRLRIKTIDGMNGFLVGQMPLLSRMGAQPQLLERADALYVQAARLALKDVSAGEAMANLLRLVNGRYQSAETLLVTMLKKRDQWMKNLVGLQGDAARHELEQGLRLLVEQELRTHVAHLSGVRELLAEACELADYAQANDQPQLQALCGAWPLGHQLADLPQWRVLAEWLLTKEGALRKAGGVTKNVGFPSGKGEAKDNKERFVNVLEGLRAAPYSEQIEQSLAFLKTLPDPHYSAAQWQTLQGLVQLLTLAAAYLKVVFRSEGQADFIEVAQAASQALGSELEPTELAQQLDYQIHHLLVDEFQDTSAEQYALIAKLLAGWQDGDGKTLFIVGDPMQSIYRFREAEVGNFLKAWRGKIGEVALTPLNLTVNFRSSRGVVEWVNRHFKQVFPKHDQIETGAVRFSEALAFSEDDSPAVTTHWALNRSAEAEAVAVYELIKQRLHELQDEPQRKIALLGRSRSSLVGIAMLLKQQGIGFRAVELEGLQARQEIQDGVALARALLHLADRPAWIALLRSPLVGLNLPDLHALLGHDFSQTVWALIQPESAESTKLTPEGQVRLRAALPVLQNALLRVGSLPFSQVVRECWWQLDGAHSVENATALDNMEVFWQTLSKVDGEALTAKRLDELLADLYAGADTSPESQRIELMTMHKSKGLEFDTVILPGLGRAPKGDDRQLVSWLQFLGKTRDGEEQEHLVIAPLDQKGQPRALLSQLLQRFEQEKSDYELARLLYVAATRAKRQLHLFGQVNFKLSDKEPLPKAPKGSLLAPLWCCVGSEFEALAAAYDTPEETLDLEVPLPCISRLPLERESLLAWLPHPYESAETAVFEAQARVGDANASVAAEQAGPFIDSDRALLNTEVGNLLHLLLEQAAQGGVAKWDGQFIERQRVMYRLWLQNKGLQGRLLDEAEARVLRSLQQALANPQVRWALSADHDEARCEYPLTSVDRESGEIAHHIVDRTFVDMQGTRWIVDYKTSIFEGDAVDLADFIAEKRAFYLPQLERYGSLLAELDKMQKGVALPQKWVLYFSDADRWVELN